MPPGQVNADLVDFSDFLPTILETTNVQVPEGLDGHSFLPQMRGKPGTPRSWIHCYYCPRPEKTPPVRFVRDQRYKLYDDGRLFDVEIDPLEESPLANAHADTAAGAAKKKFTAALESMPAKGGTLLEFP